MFIDYLTSDQKDDLATVTIQQRAKQGEAIVTEGEEATCLYIIQEGTVHVTMEGKDIRDMHSGDYFGEAALF